MEGTTTVDLRPRPLASSVEELLEGARRLGHFVPADARSGASFERVVVEGEPCVVKYVHLDQDFALRAAGDIGCIPRRVWETGLVDVSADVIDHAILGAAPWGRNGWGAALLMRDVTDELVPVGDEPVTEEEHGRFLRDLAALSARWWGRASGLGLLPAASRWSYFSDDVLTCEAELGAREPVPALARDGWRRFRSAAPGDLVEAVDAIRADPAVLADPLRTTPWTLLHGDWKFGNLGTARDGRTLLLDWAYTGEGPVAHELGWYLALNRARIPTAWTKEATIDAFATELAGQGVELDGWWDVQLDLCLLGTVAQFGWEKALGPADELVWWCDRARAGIGRL